jgi:hypothetical protein
MRIPDSCLCGGRSLVYCSIKSDRYTIRYRRCDRCGETSKSIQLKKILSSISLIDQVDAPVTMRVSSTQEIKNDNNTKADGRASGYRSDSQVLEDFAAT